RILAVDLGGLPATSNLVNLRFLRSFHKPDMILVVDEESWQLLHAPAVGQNLWPEWVDPENRRAMFVQRLSRLRRLLRRRSLGIDAHDEKHGECQNAAGTHDCCRNFESGCSRIHRSPSLRA